MGQQILARVSERREESYTEEATGDEKEEMDG